MQRANVYLGQDRTCTKVETNFRSSSETKKGLTLTRSS